LRTFVKNKGQQCAAPSCKREAKHCGYCPAHYMRLRTHGDIQDHIPIGGFHFTGKASKEDPVPEPCYVTLSDDGKLACHFDANRQAWIIYDTKAVTFYQGSRPLAQCRTDRCTSAHHALTSYQHYLQTNPVP
jgi:hypothetical protein